MSNVLAHLRAQWIGVLALLIALGTGSAYAANTVFTEDIVDGQVRAPDIASNAVREPEIVKDAVGNSELAADSVSFEQLVDQTVNTADLASNSISNAKIQRDAVREIEVADNAIDEGEVEDQSMGSAELATNSVTTGELADNAVYGINVANNSLTTADFAGTDASGAISLGAGAVGTGRCKTYDISVPGAVPGQGVIISTKAATQAGIMIYGQRVSGAGTVDMVVCNLSGTTQAAITNLPIRTITYG
jgi:hypothetical protein